jgi:hypothetical protein
LARGGSRLPGEEARQPGEIDPAKSDGQHRGPACQAERLIAAEDVPSAYSVVEKLNSSKAIRAATRIRNQARPRLKIKRR